MGETASSSSPLPTPCLAPIPTNPVLALVFETLVGSSPIDGQYVPGLADFWEIAEDGKTYTFHLTPKPCGRTARRSPRPTSFSRWTLRQTIPGQRLHRRLQRLCGSYAAVDDHTVQLVAKDVYRPDFFHGNSYCPIMAKHIWEGVDPKTGPATRAAPARI